MRKAEFVMAAVMAVLSLYLMWKSAELPIGWMKGKGPGGGAYPFWLSAGMLVSCIIIFIRGYLRKSPPSQSDETYMDRQTIKLFALVAGSLTVTVALVHVVGMYFAVALFFLYYLRFLGGHPWKTVGSFSLVFPTALFFFFEGALKITLPKGFAEPLFIPLYSLIY